MSLILIPVKKVLLAFLKGEFQSVSQTEECAIFERAAEAKDFRKQLN